MPDPFSIREGAEADLEDSAALACLAEPERSSREWIASLRRNLESPDQLLVVAESRGAIVGYGRARAFEPGPDAPADSAPGGYYLTGVFVLPEQRACGIATALTRARLDWIRERASAAWYFANVRNTASIELHRRFGFEEVSREFSFPRLRFEGGEGILFRLSL
ncbi:MAG TPA: N-acetyltransferase [Gaiellaceae bacterium]|nr:N-acetyltransferase [Gaiellaceae bacterium]